MVLLLLSNVEAITELLFIGEEECNLGVFDCVIVLGNDDTKGTVSAIIDLARKGHFRDDTIIVLSGKRGSLNQDSLKTEAQSMYDELVLKGLKYECKLEEKATNTLENFKYVKEIVDISSYKKILVVGKAFVLRRALMSALACGYDEETLTFFGTVDKEGKNIDKDNWYASPEARKRVFEELERIGKYSAQGDLFLKKDVTPKIPEPTSAYRFFAAIFQCRKKISFMLRYFR